MYQRVNLLHSKAVKPQEQIPSAPYFHGESVFPVLIHKHSHSMVLEGRTLYLHDRPL